MNNYFIRITNDKNPDKIRYVSGVDIRYINHKTTITSVSITYDINKKSKLILPFRYNFILDIIVWLKTSSLIDKDHDKIELEIELAD